MRPFRYATVCSGIECATVAARGLGWEPVFFSEIEPFPCRLLSFRYPHTPNLGDMTKIYYDESRDEIRVRDSTATIPLDGQGIDALFGGTPCQDVSCAGQRRGMAEGSGTRSSLAFHFVRLARELKPRWLVWENVPGALSSNRGRDFGRFVAALTEIGYSCGWRVLDAEFTRVDTFPRAIPHRRNRLWLVAYLGTDSAALEKVLAVLGSADGCPSPKRETWEEYTAEVKGLHSQNDSDVRDGRDIGFIDPESYCAELPGRNPSMTARHAREILVYGGAVKQSSPVAACLTSHYHKGFTLTPEDGELVIDRAPMGADLYNGKDTGAVAASLTRHMGSGIGTGPYISIEDIVRRFTPLECERLEGLEDDYTLIPTDKWRVSYPYERETVLARHPEYAQYFQTLVVNGLAVVKTCLSADGPRYKSLGNCWATNQPRYYFVRINRDWMEVNR